MLVRFHIQDESRQLTSDPSRRPSTTTAVSGWWIFVNVILSLIVNFLLVILGIQLLLRRALEDLSLSVHLTSNRLLADGHSRLRRFPPISVQAEEAEWLRVLRAVVVHRPDHTGHIHDHQQADVGGRLLRRLVTQQQRHFRRSDARTADLRAGHFLLTRQEY